MNTSRIGAILLIGGRGQIGRELARELPVLGDLIAPSSTELDITDAGAVRRIMEKVRPTLVVNAAAYTAVDRAESDSAACMLLNAGALGHLAENAARVGASLVHFSTDYVFDGTKNTPYTETDGANPLSIYGASKLAGERVLLDAGIPALTFRTSWVYDSTGRNFLNTILRLAVEQEHIRVVADQIGAPTWSRVVASTVAQAIGRLAAEPRPLGDAIGAVAGIYHLSCGGVSTWSDFAQCALDLAPGSWALRCRSVTPITTAEYPTAARRPANSRLDNAKLARTFGLRQVPWTDALRLAMDDRRHSCAE